MKNLYWKLSFAALLCFLHGCKASGGGSSDSDQLSPQTLAELILQIAGGATLEFDPDDMQATPGVETGAILYDRNAAPNITVTNALGGTTVYAWPIGFDGRYTYTVSGSESARIDFSGVSGGGTGVNADLLSGMDVNNGGLPGDIVMIFSPLGGSNIQLDEVTFTVPAIQDAGRPGTVISSTGVIRTVDGGLVPRNYTLDTSTRFSRRTDGKLDKSFIDYDDPNTMNSIDILFDATTSLPDTSVLKEIGTATFTDTATMVTVQANYRSEQPLGTDDIVISFEFVSASDTTNPFAIQLLGQGSDVYTFTFTGEFGGVFSTASGSIMGLDFDFIDFD